MRSFAITQQGQSHIQAGTNCQDFSDVKQITPEKLGHTVTVGAIADGVGSCEFSEDGSKIAVTNVLSFIEREAADLETLDDDRILAILKNAYRKALEAVEEFAEKEELPFLEFDTTLTTVFYVDDGTVYLGHIGDDGIVAMYTDGTYEMATDRLEGEESNSVIPLSETGAWEFKKLEKKAAALVLVTDGVLDMAVGSKNFSNRVFLPFFAPALLNPMSTDEEADQMKNFWEEYLGGRTDAGKAFRRTVTDDITFELIQIPELVGTLPEIHFDEDAWNAQSAAYQKKVDAVLLKDREEWEEKKREEERKQKKKNWQDDQHKQNEHMPYNEKPEQSVGQMQDGKPDQSVGQEEVEQLQQSEEQRRRKEQTNREHRGRNDDQEQKEWRIGREAAFYLKNRILRGIKNAGDFLGGIVSDEQMTGQDMTSENRMIYFGKDRARYVAGRSIRETSSLEIFEVQNKENLMLVRYKEKMLRDRNTSHSRKAMRERLSYMLSHKPETEHDQTVVVCWPTASLYTGNDEFAGYVMPGIRDAYPVESLWAPDVSKKNFPNYSRRDAYGIACRMVEAVEYVHQQGMHMGAMGLSGMMVTRKGYIIITQTDQLCMYDAAGKPVYRSYTIQKEFLAPEILKAINENRRVEFSERTDMFSLSIFLFLLLSDGRHPFEGTDPGRIRENILRGRSVLQENDQKENKETESEEIKPFFKTAGFPNPIYNLFRRTFLYNSRTADKPEIIAGRPSVQEWKEALFQAYTEEVKLRR